MADNLLFVSSKYIERLKHWLKWNNTVEDMGSFYILPGYEAHNAWGKYNRFTRYLKEWLFDAMHEGSMLGELAERFSDLHYTGKFSEKNWWKDAMAVGRGKTLKNPLPSLKNPSEENKQTVYEMLIPIYRSLKDRFDNRRGIEWLTNHGQYTAERDSIRVLEGLMKSLTGDSIEMIQAKLEDFRQEMPEPDYRAMTDLEASRERQRLEAQNKEIKRLPISDKNAKEATCNTIADLISNAMKQNNLKPKDGLGDYIRQSMYAALGSVVNKINKDYDQLTKENQTNRQIAESMGAQLRLLYKAAFRNSAHLGLPLKDQFLTAQKITDLMMNTFTPVVDEKDMYGHLGSNYLLRNQTDFLRDVAKQYLKDDATEEEITNALNEVREEIGVRVKLEQIPDNDQPNEEISAKIEETDVLKKDPLNSEL